MGPRELLEILHVAERLKDTVRHCTTSKGRPESVADHSWRLTLMAFLLKDEFPDTDMDRVMDMCLIHDLGECFTGDIPTFLKTDADEQREEQLLGDWVRSLPEPYSTRMLDLYGEMEALETQEAKIYKALDKMEAILQHNEAPISTWIPREYELNMTYGFDQAAFSPYLTALREQIRLDTAQKIEESKKAR
jgi:putative hydrolase of HD superfamily